MTNTVNLGLPFIEASQAQKHVTHNEGLRILDAVVMLAVKDRDLSVSPDTPVDGDRYLVNAPGTGAFTGHDDQIAHYADGGWTFYTPKAGWLAYVEDEGVLVAWDGDAWSDIGGGAGGGGGGGGAITELQDLEFLGVGATADATNPLSATLNNVLWSALTVADGGDGHLRYKLSKESAAKTLSLLFQDNFSGRAEIGLTGDDDFHFKTSADGTTWVDALLFDNGTGSAKINSGFFLTGSLSPSQITTDQNDYNPAGLTNASVLRLSTDASRNLTGLSGGGAGRIAAIINAGSNPIVLKDASASSTAGNRFSFGADVTLAAKQSAILWYDATDSRWKLLAGPQESGGGGGSPASTTEILTGTDTSKFVTADALAALWEKGPDVATASTISLGEGLYFNLTGTTTITDIDWDTPKDGRIAFLRAQGDFTVTHSSNLVCPENASIAVKADDILVVVQENGDIVRVLLHQRKSYSDLIYAGVGALSQKTAPVPSADRIAIRDAAGFAGKYITLEQQATLARGVPGYYGGRYLGGECQHPGQTNTLAVSANVLYAAPFFVGRKTTFTRIGIDVTTASAGNARLGAFTCGTDGAPGILLFDAGTLSTSTTGVKEVTISQDIEVGYYYLVAVFSATPTVRATVANINNPLQVLLTGVGAPGTADNQITRSFTYGALSGASPFGTPTFANANWPMIMMRIV